MNLPPVMPDFGVIPTDSSNCDRPSESRHVARKLRNAFGHEAVRPVHAHYFRVVTDADVYVAVFFFSGVSDKATHGNMRSHFLRPAIRIFADQLTDRQRCIRTIRRLTLVLASIPVFRSSSLGLVRSFL